MSENISYDTELLDAFIGECNEFKSEISKTKEAIDNDIKTIDSNWSGAEYEDAKVDLESIKNNFISFQSNISKIILHLTDVSDAFKQAKY